MEVGALLALPLLAVAVLAEAVGGPAAPPVEALGLVLIEKLPLLIQFERFNLSL